MHTSKSDLVKLGMSEGMPQGISRTVASLVRMLARSFNNLYLIFLCAVVRATGDVVNW